MLSVQVAIYLKKHRNFTTKELARVFNVNEEKMRDELLHLQSLNRVQNVEGVGWRIKN